LTVDDALEKTYQFRLPTSPRLPPGRRTIPSAFLD
jgi:hypothetical protein